MIKRKIDLGVIALFIISLILFILNYQPKTFLIGWDSLMPEFNVVLNLKRSLFAVWQDYRGLGLYDGMAHAANLIHTLFISFLKLIFPLNVIRYLSHISLHFIGGLGMYFLVKNLVNNQKIAFLAAFFYLFNLGTIQQFFAPLEAFSFHFAFLPWSFLSAINYLHQKNKRNLCKFFIVSILATPQAFVPTLFITFFLSFSSLIVYDFFKNKTIKNFLFLTLILLLVNSFWLIPFLYGVPQNAPIIKNAKINQFSSEKIYLRNKARGDIKNVLFLKGFMMDTTEFDSLNLKNISFMGVWDKYSNNLIFQTFWFIILLTIFLGIIEMVLLKKKFSFFLIPLCLSLFALATNTPFLREINDTFRENFSTIAEVFRFPFTKFITVLIFGFSVAFAFGLEFIERVFKKKKLFFLVYLMLLIYISFPAFQGIFFSPLLKRKIPQEYFAVFNYFQNQPHEKRIILLPTHTFWSWQYRRWGYVGSGFLWYGIPQAILKRAFDPWSNYNEQLFNEFKFAIDKKDKDLFNFLLKKYDIDYILLDSYFVNNIRPKPIDYEKLTIFLNKNPELKKVFHQGKLIVYRHQSNKEKNSVFFDLLSVNHYANFYYEDPVFFENKNYYLIDDADPDIIYPFANLYTEKLQVNRQFEVKDEKNRLLLFAKKSPFAYLSNPASYRLVTPDISQLKTIPVLIKMQKKNLVLTTQLPVIKIGNQIINFNRSLTIKENLNDKIESLLLTETNQRASLNQIFFIFSNYPNFLKINYKNQSSELIKIDMKKIIPINKDPIVKLNNTTTINIAVPKNSYLAVKKLPSKNWHRKKNSQELVFSINNLFYELGYLFFVKSSWVQGMPTSVYVDSHFLKDSVFESQLAKNENFNNIFFIHPQKPIGLGYGFHFINESIGALKSTTKILSFSLYPIPFDYIKGIKLEKISKLSSKNYFKVHFQSFHPGWKAYQIKCQNSSLNCQISTFFPFFFGQELKNHALINNWANGWKIESDRCKVKDETCQITIIFWPQYLEFIGFGLLLITFLFILFYQPKVQIDKNIN